MIDLHLHTTASDGHLTPDALVAAAVAVGIRTLAVTDHDTMAAIPAATTAARALGATVVPGIEITAVHTSRDVHMLGYFLDPAHAELSAFLERQRADRRRRLLEMVDRLAEIGAPVDAAWLSDRAAAAPGKALGRPLVAAALVAAGHARDIGDAFDRYLSDGRPAFVERQGASPAEVIALVARAGGVSAIAHPGKLNDDALVDELAGAGMPAIEVFHPDHDAAAVRRYLDVAARHGLLVTGGSDYHGPDTGRAAGFGRIHLPEADFARLAARAASGASS